MSRQKFVLVIGGDGWSDSIASVRSSASAASKALASYVRANWEDRFGGPFDPGQGDEALVDDYFFGDLDDQSYEILAA